MVCNLRCGETGDCGETEDVCMTGYAVDAWDAEDAGDSFASRWW